MDGADRIRRKARLVALMLATPLVALGGDACATVGRDYEAPKADVPAAWRGEPGAGLGGEAADLEQWWHRLDDPILDGLVERAISQGLDLRVAFARVRQARALRGVASSELFPAVDAAGSFEHRAESKNTPLGAVVPDTNVYTAGFDASWEVDLWGRVRRSVEAAGAELEASVADERDVAVTVAAETARNYVELRAFQRRVEIANRNVSLQEQTLDLVR